MVLVVEVSCVDGDNGTRHSARLGIPTHMIADCAVDEGDLVRPSQSADAIQLLGVGAVWPAA